MADDAKAAEGTAPKKSRKLPLILSAVLLIAGGGAGAWYLGFLPTGGGEHAEADAALSDGHGDGHGAPVKGGHGGAHGDAQGGAPPALLPIDSFIANLADQSGKRYLKATFQVEFDGAAVPADVPANMPRIRDLLLTLLSSKTFEEIRTPEGKQRLREDIINRVNQVLERDVAEAVYFTEFIVQ